MRGFRGRQPVPSRLGTLLPRKGIAWFWLAVAAVPAVYFAWQALTSNGSWVAALILAALSTLIAVEPWLRKRGTETIQVDESGVLRADGPIREQILWSDIREIRIITTNEGPYREDVFFALVAADGKGCLIPHDAAHRVKLLEELQSRFPDIDDAMVIKAMGSTSNASFVVWKGRDERA